MRAATRLFAHAAKSTGAGSGAYLTPHAPTGLTGIITHPNPRPHLIYLYNATLEKLKTLPDSSVYRTSVEALTKHRLSIVEKAVPVGYEEWKQRVSKDIEANPDVYGPASSAIASVIAGRQYLAGRQSLDDVDEREIEWEGEGIQERDEGPGTQAQKSQQAVDFGADVTHSDLLSSDVKLEPEPPLTKDQISEIENQIGAGLIEEVVIVAEREHALIDTMKDNAVWEELVEKPVEGQWTYFERDTHTGQPKAGNTQTP